MSKRLATVRANEKNSSHLKIGKITGMGIRRGGYIFFVLWTNGKESWERLDHFAGGLQHKEIRSFKAKHPNIFEAIETRKFNASENSIKNALSVANKDDKEDESHFKIIKVSGMGIQRGEYTFFVLWTTGEKSWEPLGCFDGGLQHQKIQAFRAKYPKLFEAMKARKFNASESSIKNALSVANMDDEEDESHFKIIKVSGMGIQRGGYIFFVLWKTGEKSWEPLGCFDGGLQHQEIQAFRAKYPKLFEAMKARRDQATKTTTNSAPTSSNQNSIGAILDTSNRGIVLGRHTQPAKKDVQKCEVVVLTDSSDEDEKATPKLPSSQYRQKKQIYEKISKSSDNSSSQQLTPPTPHVGISSPIECLNLCILDFANLPHPTPPIIYTPMSYEKILENRRLAPFPKKIRYVELDSSDCSEEDEHTHEESGHGGSSLQAQSNFISKSATGAKLDHQASQGILTDTAMPFRPASSSLRTQVHHRFAPYPQKSQQAKIDSSAAGSRKKANRLDQSSSNRATSPS